MVSEMLGRSVDSGVRLDVRVCVCVSRHDGMFG